jgi:hypothetical protein
MTGSTMAAEGAGGTPRARTYIPALVVAVLAFLVFSPAIGYEFLNWDDDVYVHENPRVREFSVAWFFTNAYYASYIPVTMVSHSLDYAVWGDYAGGHHLTNILLHAANTALVFLVCLALLNLHTRSPRPATFRALLKSEPLPVSFGAVVAALLFALHPLKAESVAWVSDRKDLLAAFFLLPAFLLYLAASLTGEKARAGRWRLFSIVLFALAALSKSISVVFPVVLVMVDRLVAGERSWKRIGMHVLPFALIGGIVGFITPSIVPHDKVSLMVDESTPLEDALFPFHALFFYIRKLFYPAVLSPIYPRPDLIELAIAFPMVLVITAFVLLKLRRGTWWWTVVWGSYVAFILPTVVGISSGAQPVADRYAYLATIGMFLLAGAGARRLWQMTLAARMQRIMLVLVLFSLLSVLGSLAALQSSYWKNSERLWSYVVEVFPAQREFRDAYVNLGTAYAASGRLDAAEGAFVTALGLDPKNPDVYFNLGAIAHQRGRSDEALDRFRQAIDVDPAHVKSIFNLGVLYNSAGVQDSALGYLRRAARLGYVDAQRYLKSAGQVW